MTLRRRFILQLAPIISALLFAACSGGDTPTSTAGTPGATVTTVDPSATAEANSVSPYSLPTRDVAFSVQVPAGTVGPVAVRVFGASQWEIVRSVVLTQAGGDTWTATVPLEEGALARYVYDRGDLTDFESLVARREAAAPGLEMIWRIIQVGPELTEVHDTVATWTDAPSDPSVGSVSGVVNDAVTGLPVMDAEIGVAGMHTATDFDGRYRLDGVVAGEHLVTVHRGSGDYQAASLPVTVRTGADARSTFEVAPARAITIQIQTVLPEDFPAGAVVKLYGTAWQTGGQYYTAPDEPNGLAIPLASPVRGRETERVQFALNLYEGQSVTYRYTLAGPGLSSEQQMDGDQTARSFVASRAARTRTDQIDAFRPSGATEVVLRTRVPDNTPPDVPVQFVMGPGHWMVPDGNGQWSTVLYGKPGEVLDYALRLGDAVTAGADASDDAPDGKRTLEVPPTDTAYGITVTDWVGRPGIPFLEKDGLAEVRFRISVAAGTTNSGSVLTLIGTGDLEAGVVLSAAAGDPTLYEGTATLPAGAYSFNIEREGGGAESSISVLEPEFTVAFAEETIDSWVSGWAGELPNVVSRDERFQGGYYLPDFWSPGFAALTSSTTDALEGRSTALAALSSIWSYGRTQPEPFVENRALLAPSVATPRDALLQQAADARRNKVPLVLAPQFNMEMTPDGSSLAGPKSQAWLDAWLIEAERVWLWNAEVADDINADILLLPRPTFHVFDQSGWFPSQQSFDAFDRRLIELIAEVRERFHGQILVHGGETGMDAPGAADLVGVTTFDTGHPSLGASASVAQWRAAYDALFASRLDPIHDAWERPVFIYQLQAPSTPSAGDPTGEYQQARQLEGMLQALADRTWVVGALSWSYEMIEVPAIAGDGVRGRLAEAVLQKHYELFNPEDVAAKTSG